eukprot:c53320_g1_i1 orf=204-1046(+)
MEMAAHLPGTALLWPSSSPHCQAAATPPRSASQHRSCWELSVWSWQRQRIQMSRLSRSRFAVVCAMDASLGGGAEEMPGPASVFPRIQVRDPYKLLGISRDASEEEIHAARNYLINQYANHYRSREAIESAYDKIIMKSFRERKRYKINLKFDLKKKFAELPPWVRKLSSMFEVPSSKVILQRAAFFVLLGVWSILNSDEGGPAFQVAVSLAGCIYLLNDRLKSIRRSVILGSGGFVIGWVFGSFLVPVLQPVLPRSWNLELNSALISYIFLWLSCTFSK